MQTPLGARERAVLGLAAEGLTDKEIAVKLEISVATVRTYWDRIRRKLGSSSRAHSVVKGMHVAHDQALAREGGRADIYRFLVESFRDVAVFFIDVDGVIATWNPAVERVLGYSEQEFIGLPFRALFTDEEAQCGIAEQEIQQAMIDGSVVERRTHKRKDGTTFKSSGRLTRVTDDEDNFVGFAKILGEFQV